MPTKPGLKSIIEYKGVGDEVSDMIFNQKLSYKDILVILKSKYDIDLTESSLSNFKKFVIDTVPDFLAGNEEYREKLARKYLDSVENLCYALDKIKEKIDGFESKKDWRPHSVYLNLLLSELHLILKRSGEIKPSQFIRQEINMIQINQYVQLEIVRMIDDGHIPLEQCSDQIKEFYKKAKANANIA